ncbi:hypothetical protein GCM10010377_60640 [Streptomyces viridiviolaceus]|nr:hypothetical protein GCM10010377_60640 [Streptomyces viridiviolaceus]
MTVSATECPASASMALEPLMMPATALASATPKLAAAATITVKVDPPAPGPSEDPTRGFRTVRDRRFDPCPGSPCLSMRTQYAPFCA